MGRALALLVAAALALPATAAAEDLTVYSSLRLVGVIEPQSLDTLRGELAPAARQPSPASPPSTTRRTSTRSAA